MHFAGEETKRSPAATPRRMCNEDVPQAHSILRKSPEASIWSTESLVDSLAQGFGWVAEQDGRVPGFVVGFVIGRLVADQFEILNLAVEKDFRRKGIGTQLVNCILGDAGGAGARQVFLEVRASNESARALYEQLGFCACGRRPDYYRDPVEDALLLVWHKDRRNS